MKLQTTKFGEIEVDESLCFDMVLPILGYEDETKFVIVEHKSESKFRWLQSLQTPSLAFVMTMADCFGIDYSFELPDEPQSVLEINEAEDILTFNLVSIPADNPRASTINLLAPIIVNVKTHKGGQIVLTDPKLRVDYPLIEKVEKEAVC